MRIIITISIIFLLLILTTIGLSYVLVKIFYFKNTVLVCMDLSLLIFSIILYRFWKSDIQLNKISILSTLKLIGLGVLLMLLFPFLNFTLFFRNINSGLVGVLIPNLDFFSNENFPFSKEYYFFKLLIIGPVLEELFFRGIIQTKLREKLSMTKSIILSSLFFGVWHMDLEQFIVTFLAGLLLGFIYEKNKNLLETIIVHVSVNCGNLFFQNENMTFHFKYIFYYAAIITMVFFISKKLLENKNSLNEF